MMKKSRAKLPLRKETLRALSELDLIRVAGGQEDSALLGVITRGDECVAAAQKA
jgi:hypothetical protein